ncbi:hypothetical protein NS226_10745 [Aureimonas ureilytica]|uniref:Uncharacterized protein n=1 Tax=Aureimonas ureilytica TaxID=401562 RepID=A0A175RAJ2_9HYPH|nr:hypothetical protein [Aureimonas ureilytica]KTQ95616.1 hypothetical protein NS226_10745 [Aureimonas ureilytica]
MANTLAFDAQYYLQQNPDVAAAVSRGLITAQQHYEQFGRFESRNPNAYFNTAYYLGQYPDVAAAGVNPLTHFLTFGAIEGRFENLTAQNAIDTDGNGFANEFNATAYLSANPDVAAAVQSGALKSAFQHFIEFGQFEGRTATLANGTTVTGPLGNAGSSANLVLTTGVDNLTGTSGNDTFIADNSGASTTLQLNATDTINGGLGNDTLKVYLGSNALAVPNATITNVENLYINGGAVSANTSLDVTKMTGLTSVVLDSVAETAGKTLTVTTSGQSVTLQNSSVASGSGTFTTALTSTSDTSAKVVLNNVTTGTSGVTQTVDFAGTKVATANITSTGSANAVTLTNTGTALTALNVLGDKAVVISENLSGLKTINASAATGNVTVDTSAGPANAALSFTGGAGNDKIIFASGAITSTTVLDGGAGTDTLAIKDVSLTSANAGINAAKNFEILSFVGGVTDGATPANNQGIIADLSKVTSVSQFSIDSATTGATSTAGVSFSGEANTHTIILNANVTGGAGSSSAGATGLVVTPMTDNASNIANLVLDGVTVTGGAGNGTNQNGGAAVNLSSFETVNITSSFNSAGTGSNALVGGALTGTGTAGSGLLVGANATVNISGSADINLGSIVSNFGASTNNNLILNAANLSGKLTAVTGAGNDVITGGSGINAITLGGGADTVDLSRSTAKADVITFSSAVGTLKTGVAISGFTDVTTNGDKLVLLNGTTIAAAGSAVTSGSGATAVTATIGNGGVVSFSNVGASAGLSDYVDAAFKAIGANAHTAAAFQFNGDTYVVEEVGGTGGQFDAGTDLVVKLVGVTSATGGLSTTASDSTHILIG